MLKRPGRQVVGPEVKDLLRGGLIRRPASRRQSRPRGSAFCWRVWGLGRESSVGPQTRWGPAYGRPGGRIL